MARGQSELQRFAAIGALAEIEKLQAEIDRIRESVSLTSAWRADDCLCGCYFRNH